METTNYEKFQTRNPVVLRLFDGFFETVGRMVAEVEPESVLDAGCGSGVVTARLAQMNPAGETVGLEPDGMAWSPLELP